MAELQHYISATQADCLAFCSDKIYNEDKQNERHPADQVELPKESLIALEK